MFLIMSLVFILISMPPANLINYEFLSIDFVRKKLTQCQYKKYYNKKKWSPD